MMPFGRVPLAILAAFVLLVLALFRGSGDDAPLGEAAAIRPADTVPPLSIPRRTSTTGQPGEAPSPASTAPPGSSAPVTPTTIPPPVVTTPPGSEAPATTATTLRRTMATTTTSRCPSGSVAWEITYGATEDEPDTWTVEVSGTITNTSDAAVRVGPVTSTIEVRPPSGSSQEPTVRLPSTVAQERLARDQTTTFSGTTTVESTSPPALTATVVGRQWDDESARSDCSPP